MKKIIGLLGICLIPWLAGCGLENSDYEIKVNDNLYLSQINPQQVLLVRSDDSIIIDTNNDADVSRSIAALDWNKEYFIAKSDVIDIDKESTKPLYWIYNIKEDKLDGSLSKAAFDKLLAEKGITLTLEKYNKRIKGENKIYE
ncbi:hypothetical protein [Listeria booriae]|uniref:Lipoprotein n=1 Tax=Listeria booriae TaxID=1552123 RepID=A0A7X1DLW7_9LIST|nr:hypothetical protein [Listeria booriae]MBC1286759.1 hypothetical protein [Listeria booriae]MBC1565317.1 hypothetical protein [Listeria booriae]MBC2195269.1 hypothetical protein [Listeria booriae]MBC2283776.1 hypothetical protein [Listeria booriae]MBC2292122.1 hypothetical protein [Listeria booriae]